MLTLFGIKSCDTCRKARKYLADKDIDFSFHDFRADGLDLQMLQRWAKHVEWTKLLNKQSLTWRKIPEVDRGDTSKERAFVLMIDNPTLIKRPVLESDTFVEVGFSAKQYDQCCDDR